MFGTPSASRVAVSEWTASLQLVTPSGLEKSLACLGEMGCLLATLVHSCLGFVSSYLQAPSKQLAVGWTRTAVFLTAFEMSCISPTAARFSPKTADWPVCPPAPGTCISPSSLQLMYLNFHPHMITTSFQPSFQHLQFLIMKKMDLFEMLKLGRNDTITLFDFWSVTILSIPAWDIHIEHINLFLILCTIPCSKASTF